MSARLAGLAEIRTVSGSRTGPGTAPVAEPRARALLSMSTMPPHARPSLEPRKPPNLPAALRFAMDQLQAGADPQEVAADLIRQRAEEAIFRAQLPPGDPRQALVTTLVLALAGRTFDDSALDAGPAGGYVAQPPNEWRPSDGALQSLYSSANTTR